MAKFADEELSVALDEALKRDASDVVSLIIDETTRRSFKTPLK